MEKSLTESVFDFIVSEEGVTESALAEKFGFTCQWEVEQVFKSLQAVGLVVKVGNKWVPTELATSDLLEDRIFRYLFFKNGATKKEIMVAFSLYQWEAEIMLSGLSTHRRIEKKGDKYLISKEKSNATFKG